MKISAYPLKKSEINIDLAKKETTLDRSAICRKKKYYMAQKNNKQTNTTNISHLQSK